MRWLRFRRRGVRFVVGLVAGHVDWLKIKPNQTYETKKKQFSKGPCTPTDPNGPCPTVVFLFFAFTLFTVSLSPFLCFFPLAFFLSFLVFLFSCFAFLFFILLLVYSLLFFIFIIKFPSSIIHKYYRMSMNIYFAIH